MAGWDHELSADKEELKNIINACKDIPNMLGKKTFKIVESKQQIKAFRRSIVAKHNLKKGKIIKESDLDFKRPGNGLSPENMKKLIGKKLRHNINFDQQLKFKNF